MLATGGGLGGAGSVLTAPLLLALLAPRATRRAAAAALLAPPLLDLLARRPAVDPVRWCALRLVDDLAYATGVWRGCWTGRTLRPLRPRLPPDLSSPRGASSRSSCTGWPTTTAHDRAHRSDQTYKQNSILLVGGSGPTTLLGTPGQRISTLRSAWQV